MAYLIFSKIVKPKRIEAPLMMQPFVLATMSISSCYTFVVADSSFSFQVHALTNYLYWVALWIYLISYGGQAVIELRDVGHVPHVRTRKKEMKNRKIRRPRLPFYQRNLHRKRVRLRNQCSLSPIEQRWADDDDPLQGMRSFPYWRFLHTSVLGDLWDNLCSVNPDILSLTLANTAGLFRKTMHTQPDVVHSFGLLSNYEFHLTQATKTNDLFRFQSVFHVQSDTNGAPIIFDSGASISITPYAEDFIGEIDYDVDTSGNKQLLGISSATQIIGVGKMSLTVYTDTGARRNLITTAYLVPDARIQLLSICRYREQYPREGCSFIISDNGCSFTFPRSMGGGKITFDYRGSNYIPRATAYSQQFNKNFPNGQVFMVLEDSNLNLTPAQKELLKWHFFGSL